MPARPDASAVVHQLLVGLRFPNFGGGLGALERHLDGARFGFALQLAADDDGALGAALGAGVFEAQSPNEIAARIDDGGDQLAGMHQLALDDRAFLSDCERVHLPANGLLHDHKQSAGDFCRPIGTSLAVAMTSASLMASVIFAGTSAPDIIEGTAGTLIRFPCCARDNTLNRATRQAVFTSERVLARACGAIQCRKTLTIASVRIAFGLSSPRRSGPDLAASFSCPPYCQLA